MEVLHVLDKLTGRTKVVEKALDGAWLRNEAIAQNISNVNTPGYKRKSVAFEEVLSQAMDKSSFKGLRTDQRHIPIGSSSIDEVDIKVSEEPRALQMRLDGNNIDIDSEMASMAKNSIQYNTLMQRLAGQFRSIKSVISEGRR
jgi:flagellar basal-body rod protein FlgB